LIHRGVTSCIIHCLVNGKFIVRASKAAKDLKGTVQRQLTGVESGINR